MSDSFKTVLLAALASAVLGFVAPLTSAQDTFVEGFDGGSNQGGWRWGTGNESIIPLNGNPGAYLQDNTLVSFRPTLSSQPEPASSFTGNYRTRRVTALGVDLVTLDKSFPVESNRFVTLALMNDSAFGLTAAIWTADPEAAIRIGDRLATGTVFMNRCDYLDPALAWTGVKDSGRGCSLSSLGYAALTRPKSLHLRTAL